MAIEASAGLLAPLRVGMSLMVTEARYLDHAGEEREFLPPDGA